VNALDHLVINVADVARSAEWYRRILGMEVKEFDPGPGKTPRTSLVFGNQKINVRPRNADKVEWFTADHETAGSDDLCFLTANTPDQASPISRPTASRSRKALSPSKAPAARCVRSIAGIPMEV
jgi:catechol 2,3-dioxygenase-like lactoylglutathione lyase family enzyme